MAAGTSGSSSDSEEEVKWVHPRKSKRQKVTIDYRQLQRHGYLGIDDLLELPEKPKDESTAREVFCHSASQVTRTLLKSAALGSLRIWRYILAVLLSYMHPPYLTAFILFAADRDRNSFRKAQGSRNEGRSEQRNASQGYCIWKCRHICSSGSEDATSTRFFLFLFDAERRDAVFLLCTGRLV